MTTLVKNIFSFLFTKYKDILCNLCLNQSHLYPCINKSLEGLLANYFMLKKLLVTIHIISHILYQKVKFVLLVFNNCILFVKTQDLKTCDDEKEGKSFLG